MKINQLKKLTLLLLFCQTVLWGWNVTTIDAGIDFGNPTSRAIVVDSNDHLHGVFGKNRLYHKEYAAGMQTETVDDTLHSGQYPSVAIDADDMLYIAYGSGFTTLKCAIGTAGNYRLYTVDTDVILLATTISIAVDSAKVPHIAYIKSDNTLHHAWYDGTWHTEEVVSSDVRNNVSIAIDNNDNLHLSYGTTNALKYIEKIGSSWQSALVVGNSSNDNAFSSIAVDSSNNVRIAYYASNTNNGDLILAEKSGTSFSKTTLAGSADNSGWAPSLAIDGTTCYVSYRNTDSSGNITIKYIRYDGTISVVYVDTISIFGDSALAIGPYGGVYVLYNFTNSTMDYYFDNQRHVFVTKSEVGKYTAVTSDGNGHLHLSYTDNGKLHYASNASGTWDTVTVDDSSYFRETAIAADANNYAHICYYDDGAKDLKYATNRSGSWSVQTVDDSGSIGGTDGTCDIALDSNGKAYISYYDPSGDMLRYTTNRDGSWTQLGALSGSNARYNAVTVNSNDEANISDPTLAESYVDIALDGGDHWHKSYFDSGAVHYRTSLGSTYSHDMSVAGNHSRIAVDRAQNTYIAFYKSDTQDVKLLSNMTGVWQTETVESSGSVGEYASVALANDDNLSVCYYNADYKALQCASKTLDRVDNAFKSLYHTLDGDNWNDNSGWLSSSDKCTWYGVVCDTDGNISLELNNSNLSGTLPPELLDIPRLNKISFYNNHISGNIPDWISNIDSLQTLILSSNELSGTIPESLMNLTNLKVLNLHKNHLVGNIPSSIGNNLSKLEVLSFSTNELNGSIPSSIGSLSNLKELYLYENNLTGPIPTTFENLKNLTKLFLWDNHLNGNIPSELGEMTNLKKLYLNNNDLNGNIPGNLGKLDHLERLDLSNNQLSGTFPDFLLGSTKPLEALNLSQNHFSGTIPSAISSLKNMKWLMLEFNQFDGSIPSSITKLKTLYQLGLRGNSLSGTIPELDENLSQVWYMTLGSNELTGPIPNSICKLSGLTILELSSNKLTGSIPSCIDNLKKLQRLYANNNQLSGSIPDTIGGIGEELMSLWLQENQLSGTIPSSLNNLTNLYDFYANSNHLTGTIPDMSNLTWLHYLDLHDNMLSGEIPVSLKDLPLKLNNPSLDLSSNCNLFSNDESLKTFLDAHAGAYAYIIETNGHCPVLTPIITYLLF